MNHFSFIFQQSLVAFALGLVLGFVAVQTGSVLPAILFHVTHNSLAILLKNLSTRLEDPGHWLHWLAQNASADEPLYRWPVIAASLLVSVAIIQWFEKHRKGVRETTNVYNAHIKPALGDTKLSALTSGAIKAWHERLATAPAKLRTGKFAKKENRRAIPKTSNERRARKATANRIVVSAPAAAE